MSDVIDKKIQIQMILEAAKALQSVEGLAEKLSLLNKANTGALSKELSGLGDAADKAGSRMKQATRNMEEQFASLKQKVREVVQLADKEWQDNGGKISPATQRSYRDAVMELRNFEKQLGMGGFSKQIQALENIRMTIDKTHPYYQMLIQDIKQLRREEQAFKAETSIKEGTQQNSLLSVQNLGNTMKHHLNWMVSGALIGGLFALPYELAKTIKEIEEGMAGVKQVLNKEGQSIEHDQGLANQELKEFIGIASVYGEAAEQVIDAARSWGRMYKDLDTVNLLVSQSAKMATADNFSMAESVKGLESAMSQFGMKSEKYNEIQVNSNRILDVWTKLAHNAGVSANDLTQAVERAGSAAYQTGVSFEFFNALVATGVRNTARSGAEIGQALKSMFSSIHSDKAIAEIEKLGVSVYKFREDGTKEFRDVQSVILDLALATQSTDKDITKLLEKVAGGKWQWSKTGAILGDYKQILENWQMAVNSAGFTNEQVAIQMDTLSRKIKSLKAETDGLFSDIGAKGLGSYLKEQTASLTNFTRGLREISGQAIIVGAALFKLTGVLLLVKNLIQGVGFANGFLAAQQALANGAEVESIAVDARKIVSTRGVTLGLMEQARAQGMLAATTTTANGMGLAGLALANSWVLILAAVAYGIYSVVEAQGKQSLMMDEINGKSAEQNDILLKQLETNKQQEDFINTLVEEYQKLSAQIQENSSNTAENAQKQEQMKTILEILARQLHTNAEELLKDGQLQIDKINELSSANRDEAKANLENNIAKMQAEYEATQQFITNTQERIKAMQAELKDVGILGRAYQWLMNIMAQSKLKQAQGIRDYLQTGKGSMEVTGGYKVPYGQTYLTNEDLTAQADQLEQQGNALLGQAGQSGIDALQQQLVNAEGHATDLSNRITNTQRQINAIETQNSKNNSGGTVDDPEKKNKNKGGSGPANAPDFTERVKRMQLQHEENQLFLDLKKSQDDYAANLDTLKTKEEIYGQTVGSIIKKQGLMTSRYAQMGTEIGKLTERKSSLQTELDGLIAKDEVFQANIKDSGVKWDSLTKEQKRQLIHEGQQYMQNYQTINKVLTLLEQIEAKESELNKERIKLGNDISATNFKGVFDDKAIYDRQLKQVSADESIQKSGLDKRHPLLRFNQQDVEFAAEMRRLALYHDRLRQLEKDLKDLQKVRQKEIQDNAPKIKEDQDKLNEVQATLNQLTKDGKTDTDEYNTALEEEKRLLEEIQQLTSPDNADIIDTKEAIQGLKVNIADSTDKVTELKKKWTEVKQFWADSLIEMSQNGVHFGDVMKKLWQDLQKEVIYRMFGIQNQGASILTQMAGKKGKGKGKGKGLSTGGVRTGSWGVGVGVGARASGGDVKKDKPYFVGEKGIELFVPSGDGEIVPNHKIKGHEIVPQFTNPGTMEKVNALSKIQVNTDSERQIKMMEQLIDTVKQTQIQQQPIVIQTIDSQSTAEFFKRNGEMLVSVLRQQGALNNKV